MPARSGHAVFPFQAGAAVFVHLHCHSHYSFLRGVASPEEIIAAAVEQKMPAVALTDTNGLYAAVQFYKLAQEARIKPIFGVALDIQWRVTSGEWREGIGEIPHCARNDRRTHSMSLVLLAADMEGYSNLCQLVTLRHLGTTQLSQNMNPAETDGRPVTLQELADHSRGVIALCPAASPGSRITNHLSQLKEIFGDRLYIEVQRLSPGDGRTLREAERLGRELGVPLVATNNVHFLRPEEHLHHRAVNAIRTCELLTTVAPPEITTAEAWFKSAAEMQKLFPDHPELLQATLEIADRCNLQLELGKLIFPECTVPEGETPDSYLEKVSLEGALKRYHSVTPEVRSRLMRELAVIKKWSLSPYFLLVLDIVNEARRRGIPAVARGSAASSMVTYCLGISRVCPLRWGLYFERFLNEQRGDCPDIDIDICGARRDELLDYVYEHWGAEHVAMIASFITMHARLAVREVAKVFGVPPAEVDRFAKRLPHRPVGEILQAIRALPECRDLPIDDEPWKTILQVALRLDDAPRHLGIHPCGTVISAKPLTRLTPLERATKGIVVTQYDMNAIEDLGLIKMDLLGQRGFTTMSLALDNIERSLQPIEAALASPASDTSSVAPDGVTPCPKPRELDFDAIPENDPATCDVIAAGRTMGVFQIESPAMRGMLRMMNARTLEEMAIALATIRPGAAAYDDGAYRMAYLKTHHPAEFLAAMCSAGAGFYHVSAYVEEAKRWGIAVRLPSVNHSRMEYTAETGQDGQRALRVGLMQIKGLRIETITAILRTREERGPFLSLEDFLLRVPVERDEIEALIKCGAFDEMGDEMGDEVNEEAHRMTRPEMLWRWNLLKSAGKGAPPAASRSP